MMADTADNYLAWDDVEPVTVTSKAGPQSVNVSHGKRRAISRREGTMLGIGINPATTSWSLPVALLQGLVPAQGDTITDSCGVDWIIGDTIELLGQWSRYRVIATRGV